jgi:hypothetical protein
VGLNARSLAINTNKERYFTNQRILRYGSMESLDSKMDRLSPDQRKEVEDFVDFLIYRTGNQVESHASVPSPPPIQNLAPPLSPAEPVHDPEGSPSGIYNAPAAGNSSYVRNEERPVPVREIVVSGDDQITREYIDYGRYEQNSPATLAVKNVKEKLQKRRDQEKPPVSLDWID